MKKMIYYSKLLVLRPSLVLFFISVISISCIITAFLLKSPPDFTDPTLGFEARGTDISKKLTTWRNLLDETRPSGSLIVNPKDIHQRYKNELLFQKQRKKNKSRHGHQEKKKKQKVKFDKKMKILKDFVMNKSFNVDIAYNSEDVANDTTAEEHSHYDYGTNKTYDEESEKKNKKLKTEKWNNLRNVEPPPITSTDFHSTDGFFCESPRKLHLHITQF
jgi:protein dispatched 1